MRSLRKLNIYSYYTTHRKAQNHTNCKMSDEYSSDSSESAAPPQPAPLEKKKTKRVPSQKQLDVLRRAREARAAKAQQKKNDAALAKAQAQKAEKKARKKSRRVVTVHAPPPPIQEDSSSSDDEPQMIYIQPPAPLKKKKKKKRRLSSDRPLCNAQPIRAMMNLSTSTSTRLSVGMRVFISHKYLTAP